MRTKLERIFDQYNKKYFENKLPKIRVKWDKKLLRREDCLGVYCGGNDTHKPHIELATEIRFSPRIYKWCILHEMVHCKNKDTNNEVAHGKDFQAEMKKLVKKDAFRNLW